MAVCSEKTPLTSLVNVPFSHKYKPESLMSLPRCVIFPKTTPRLVNTSQENDCSAHAFPSGEKTCSTVPLGFSNQSGRAELCPTGPRSFGVGFLTGRVLDVIYRPKKPGTHCPTNPGTISLGARMPILWTVKDLVQQLQLKPSTVYACTAQGKIPSLKIHGLLRFRPEEIAQWVESFHQHRSDSVRAGPRHVEQDDLTEFIARARREVYSARHGETRLRSSLIGKEEHDGARETE